MRQVPRDATFGVIGDGKLAHHLQRYFTLTKHPYITWNRKETTSAEQKLANSDIIMLAIRDSALESFLRDNAFLQNKIVMHFSGSLYFENAIGCHPLMTFSPALYELPTYESIPFIVDSHVDTVKTIFAKLKNPIHPIAPEKKAYYHALCVLSGNLTQFVWQETFERFAGLELSKDTLLPYLKQVSSNLAEQQQTLTGPLQRKDRVTVEKNLYALKNDPLKNVYVAFGKTVWPEFSWEKFT